MVKTPKLRTVDKYNPPYPLNKFPKNFAISLGKEVIYLLTSRGRASLEGEDWEEIFARIIGAKWKTSNVGLDDIVYEQTAWGAKTVKNSKPSKASIIRLISGRNSPIYSYGDTEILKSNLNELGEKVLSIWNERVMGVRKLYRHVRTIVLIKSNDLLELALFEFDTTIYPIDLYWWKWNQRGNLEGYEKKENNHIFTWQPHGSQFTIIEEVPHDRLALKIKKPPKIDRDGLLKSINFDETWVEIIK
jgi:hypothetical protein